MPPLTSDLDRRAVLRMIAAGAAASIASCSRPQQTTYPAVDPTGRTAPGTTTRYATSIPLAGYGRGVTGLVVDDRPIKLEGLLSHPASRGATDLFAEVSILDLYDPQRLQAPSGPDGPASWSDVARVAYGAANASGGGEFALLTGRITSPTILAQVAALKALRPQLRHVRWEPFGDDAAIAASRSAFGRPLTARPRFQDADVILSLGADPLGPGPDQIAWARAWAGRRRRNPMPRLHVIEASMTATGAMADRRVSAGTDHIAHVCHALAFHIAGAGEVPHMPASLADIAAVAARDLLGAKGRALILAGPSQPADVHAFAAWANGVLEAPLDWIDPVDPDPTEHEKGLSVLAADMHEGRIGTLLVIGANPVYAAPAALRFADAMGRVKLTMTSTTTPNETSAAAHWRLPLSHPLETWCDYRGPDGTASIAQPLVRPLHDSRSVTEVLALLGSPADGNDDLSRVRRTWRSLGDEAWRSAIEAGVIANSAAEPVRIAAMHQVLPPLSAGPAFAVEIRLSPTLHDGGFSSNAWAQECPDPMTKEVWGASAWMNADDMAALSLSDGDLVRFSRGREALVQPVRAVRGQARGVATLFAGYGRIGTGAVADGIGTNAFRLSGEGEATATKQAGSRRVTSTQPIFALDGDLAKLFPVIGPRQATKHPAPGPTLVPAEPHPNGATPQWAMAIDTDVCIGCNACVVACQAENNVPVIGPEQMAVGRDMHWLRVDRYDIDATGGAGFQPVPCMHCEKAPCEPVCPVEASVHNDEGLNLQVYNRCIGTRFCQANCPYKVRRFNFLDYNDGAVWGGEDALSIAAQRNPDVSVRARGVMEKCTYCVQRIETAEHDADARHAGVGAVVTACQAACPTEAIRFGTLNEAEGAIPTARADPRHYGLLEELGTRPRTTYLARRINPGSGT